jgi:hypothetical protein
MPVFEDAQQRPLDRVLGKIHIPNQQIGALQQARQRFCGEPPELLILGQTPTRNMGTDLGTLHDHNPY